MPAHAKPGSGWIGAAAACAGLGLLSALAAAVGCTLWARPRFVGKPIWPVEIVSVGWSSVEVATADDSRVPPETWTAHGRWRTARSGEGSAAVENAREIVWRVWTFYEAGWPWTAVWGWNAHEPGKAEVTFGVLDLPHRGWDNDSSTANRAVMPRSPLAKTIPLPWLPYWLGLLGDTAVFGAAWFVVLFGIGRVRGVIRRRRGKCAVCGYDRKGLAEGAACPECGSLMPHRP
ncbi:hypothetical protein PHYC_02521 [Phycisphaerales bacterium]|nr:hypothetical protein PHYC_02521 [Phycisphaerales bacterium]